MKKLKEIREEANITQERLAEHTGLSRTLISAYELETVEAPKFKSVEALASYFHGYRDDIHKQFKRIPRDVFFQLVNSKLSFDEVRAILNKAGI